MVNILNIGPNRRVEYNYDLPVNLNEGFVWLAYLVQNGVPIIFQMLDRENNLILYSTNQQVEFVGKLKYKKTEKLKFIFINTANNQVT